jgi:predicted nucleic acid-binding Zn ribbon protein
LAAIQARWPEAVGERVAAASRPVSERAGTLVVECDDPVWAEELQLMQDQLLQRLGQALGDQAPKSLRFRAAADPH